MITVEDCEGTHHCHEDEDYTVDKHGHLHLLNNQGTITTTYNQHHWRKAETH